MDDSTMFMQWALDMLQHEHPVAAVVDDDCAETTFPSLRALRDASLVMDAHAANTSVSGGTDGSGGGGNSLSIAPAAMELQASPPTAPVMWWNFSADSAQPDSDGNGKFHVVARPHGGSTPMRRGFGKTTPATYAQGHVMAERKRRENINRRFIELSTVVPGLKKMDKATILSDATAHIKELQEKIKALEAAGGRSIQTVALVHKPDKNRFPPSSARRTALPEIEARMSENSVNVRIHCANEKGLVVKVLAEMEEGLYLSLTNTTVIPFTAGTVIITITAKVEEGVSVTPDSILQRLNASLQRQDSFNSH